MNSRAFAADPRVGGLLATITLLCLLVGLGEVWFQAPARNDALLHLHQTARMNHAIAHGQPLLDHWDPTIGLGYPFFRTYAGFTHLVILLGARLQGGMESLPRWWNIFVFFGWTLLPLCLYHGARCLGRPPLEAVGAAWLIPLLHSVFRFGIAPESYFWIGYGLLPNLISLLFFPLALGYGYRFIAQDKHLLPALLFLSGTFFAHPIPGYCAAVSLVLSAGLRAFQDQSLRPLARLLLLGVWTVGTCLFFLLPYVQDPINKTILEPAPYWHGYGPAAVAKATISGHLFDHHVAVPVVSLLCLAGLFLERRRHGAWSPVAWLFGFWWVCYLGRHAWNPLLRLLPFHADLSVERLILPTQVFAVLLGGNALAALWRRLPSRGATPVSIVLTGVLFSGHLGKNLQASWVSTPPLKAAFREAHQRLSADLGDTLTFLDHQAELGGGRLYVSPAVSGGVALEAFPLQHDLPHVGRLFHTMSAPSDFLYALQPDKADQWTLFGIQYGLGPIPPSTQLRHMHTGGPYALVQNTAYLGLFDLGVITRVLEGRPVDHREEVLAWMRSPMPGKGHYLGFSAGGPVAVSPQPSSPTDRPTYQGPLLEETKGYHYTLQVTSATDTYLVGRLSYHPGWKAEVDGVPVPTVQVSPGFPAVPVPAGTHAVRLSYIGSSHAGLLWLAAAFIATAGWYDRRPKVRHVNRGNPPIPT